MNNVWAAQCVTLRYLEYENYYSLIMVNVVMFSVSMAHYHLLDEQNIYI